MAFIPDAIKAIPAGRYIVAVSGGLDSMVLLHNLITHTDVDIIVAHINHGIRGDAGLDTAFIETFCESHNITHVSTDLHLGKKTSEACARRHRYDFLQKCRIKYKAHAIITAHHQDDLLETALINMLRGTGWRGIAPFVETPYVLRPLLRVAKKDIRNYALHYGVPWREDSTNIDQKYLRNYVRHSVLHWFDQRSSNWRPHIMRYVRNQQTLRRTIEAELNILLPVYVKNMTDSPRATRYIWCMLPEREAYELFQALCRHILGTSLLRTQAEAALLFIKVARPGKRMQLDNNWQLRVTRKQFIVEPR